MFDLHALQSGKFLDDTIANTQTVRPSVYWFSDLCGSISILDGDCFHIFGFGLVMNRWRQSVNKKCNYELVANLSIEGYSNGVIYCWFAIEM